VAEFLSLQEVAELLGVHYMTAYRYVRLGMLPAHKEGSTWRVGLVDVEAFQRGDGAGVPAGSLPGPRAGGGRWIARLESRLLAGDGAGAWQVLEAAMASGADLPGIELEIVTPAMVSIGERWAAGEIDIAAEHQASVIVTRLLGRLGARFMKRGRTRGSVVLGSVAGDRHGLPVMILADLLAAARFEVIDLGCDVPAGSFVHAARAAQRLVAVGISITTPDLDGPATGTVTALHSALADVPVLVGGWAISGMDHATALGADGWAADGAAAVALVENLAAPPLAGGAG
jgi:excisionase family DNA binding protein